MYFASSLRNMRFMWLCVSPSIAWRVSRALCSHWRSIFFAPLLFFFKPCVADLLFFGMAVNAEHVMWLAREAALAVKHGSLKMPKLLRCLDKQINLEHNLYNEFTASLRQAECMYHIEKAHEQVYTDQCNTENLCRFLWDYMTEWNVPRFREFFNNDPTAQMYDFADGYGYGIVFHSPKLYTGPASLVIYSIVMPAAETSGQWMLRRRQQSSVLKCVVNHIKTHLPMIVKGINLGEMTMYVANNVFDDDAVGISLLSDVLNPPQRKICATASLGDTIDASLLAPDADSSTKSTKRQRRRARRAIAATTIQRHSATLIARSLSRKRAACLVQQAYRRRLSSREREQTADSPAPTLSTTNIADADLAFRLAKEETMDQVGIAQKIQDERIRIECQSLMDDLCLEVEAAERRRVLYSVCAGLIDDVVEGAAAASEQRNESRRAHAVASSHRRLQSIQTSCGSLATVCVTLHGQVYQLHAARTSVLATMVDDGRLAERLIASTPEELNALFAPRAEASLLVTST